MGEFDPEAAGAQLPLPGMQVAESPAPIYVSKEDRLESANLHLKAIVALRDLQLFQAQVEKKSEEHKLLQLEILKKRKEIEAKYGLDLNTCQIREEDGLVIPRPGSAGLADTMARMRMR